MRLYEAGGRDKDVWAMVCRDKEDIKGSLLPAITPQVKLVILDSVTSNTAICLPAQELIASVRCRWVYANVGRLSTAFPSRSCFE
jgi:selenocysteine lyase/cysteine desulfurase